VTGHVEVEVPTTPVFDDGESAKQLEGNPRHGEEVARDDCLTVILQEREPPFCRILTSTNAPQVASHGSLGDNEADLQRRTVNLEGSPPKFSSAVRRMSRRISSVIFGRPPRGRERHRQ